MNLPNKLTVARIIATPFFMLVLMLDFKYSYSAALLIFAAASLTDMFDGKIARKRNLVTDFGKFLDPLADKMLTTAAFLGFIYRGIGWKITWIVFIVLFREFLIASLRLVVVSSNQKKVIAANMWGKAKTVAQMAGIIIALLVEQYKQLIPESPAVPALDAAVSVILWAGAVLCIISGGIYLYQNREAVDPTK